MIHNYPCAKDIKGAYFRQRQDERTVLANRIRPAGRGISSRVVFCHGNNIGWAMKGLTSVSVFAISCINFSLYLDFL